MALTRLYTGWFFSRKPGWGANVGMRFAMLLCAAAPVLAQNAEISGFISDPSGLAVQGARVAVKSAHTDAKREGSSNQQGAYSVPSLPPGVYDVTIETNGFKTIHQNGVLLEVGQGARLDFTLTIGDIAETITVEGRAPLHSASDASVSTVIGNRLVENLPLNGRSFSSLIILTPGVALTSSNFFEQGQFSVNGQRPDANYFTIDGVAANLGVGASNLGQGGAGQLPATSAFGGTSNLVSIDALQEFRIQTSTFAPEYGRTPGAQISVVTKSGTNAMHGTAFEYFRNNLLDANNWFANSKGLPKPALRQNDYGGVLGGPIRKDKLFFFGSYEGLRLRQPGVANTYVPSLATRQNAPAAVQPLLNAFPLPNGPDFGNGTAGFSAGYSDPSTLNSSSVRMDYLPWQRMTLFGRYSDAPSTIAQRTGGGSLGANYSTIFHTEYRTQSLTLGSNQNLAPRWASEFRFNYSRNRAHAFQTLDNFQGAVPPADSVLYPSYATPENATIAVFGDSNSFGLRLFSGERANNLMQQFNVTENISWIVGTHRLKFGLDYRRLRAEGNIRQYEIQYNFQSLANVLSNNLAQATLDSRTPATLVFPNLSLFAQDTWSVGRKLTITYGLRWEYNAAPSSPDGTLPFTVSQVNNFATMTLAPPGTALWTPQKDNFAPRLGLAWQAFPNLVIRAGAGVYYDLGYAVVANAMTAFPYLQERVVVGTSYPLSGANAAPPAYTTNPPVPYLAVVDPHHVLPRTYEWNAAIEQSLGEANILTLTYLGAAGRKLMLREDVIAANPQLAGQLTLMSNAANSSYNALQAQFVRRLSHGFQTLLSYTWAHSIDDGSSDGNFQDVGVGKLPSSHQRGPSDYDLRHTFSGAVSYDIPGPPGGVLKQVFGRWSTDSIVYARTASPVNVVTGQSLFGVALSGASVQRPNVVPGVPLYLDRPNAPGGQVINRAAFSSPGTAQGNLGRNALLGFGAAQWDLSLRRQFRLTERISLQARGDFFNILNHPNFGSPVNSLSSPQFGQTTQMLASSLGSGGQSGGVNPLYQIGGPRSIQLALKLLF